MSVGEEQFVSFRTYRKNGEPKSVPVWIVDLADGKLGFTTPSNSWKLKRLANNSNVQIQPSDGRGAVRSGSTVTEGTAVVVQPGDPEFDQLNDALNKKYGMQRKAAQVAIKARARMGGPVNFGVIVTPR